MKNLVNNLIPETIMMSRPACFGGLLSFLLACFSFPMSSFCQTEVCKTSMNISIAEDGNLTLTPQMLLAGSRPDYSVYDVDIMGYLEDDLDCTHVGQRFMVSVINSDTGNRCMTEVFIEDKIAPQCQVQDVTMDVQCDEEFTDEVYYELFQFEDNCTPSSVLDYTISRSITDFDCSDPRTKQEIITAQVSDEYGNSHSCQLTINFVRYTESVVFPSDETVSCSDDLAIGVDLLGAPTIGGNPLSLLCGYEANYHDVPLPSIPVGCVGSYNIYRYWQLYDRCGVQLVDHIQTISVQDDTPPIVHCPEFLYQNTDLDACTSDITIPEISVTDLCAPDDQLTIEVVYNGMTYAVGDQLSDLPVGNHVFEYTVTDPCLQSATCTTTIIIEDNQRPSLICPSSIDVVVNAQGQAICTPQDINTILSDNCTDYNTMPPPNHLIQIRRMINRCNRPQDLEYGDEVMYCCTDINQTTMMQLQVEDDNGNVNNCMFEVNVLDTLMPIIHCNDDITVFLDANGTYNIDTSELLNFVSDNCGIRDTILSQSTFDCDDAGTVVPITLSVSDIYGNSNSCVINLTVEDNRRPQLSCLDDAVASFGSDGMVVFDVDDILSINEACPIQSVTYVPDDFNCSDHDGTDQSIEITVTDQSGLSSTITCTVALRSDMACTTRRVREASVVNTRSNNEERVEVEFEYARPVPFSDYTDIPFRLEAASDLTIQIFDIHGRMIKEETKFFEKNKQQYRIYRNQLKNDGVYYVHFFSQNKFIHVSKIIAM